MNELGALRAVDSVERTNVRAPSITPLRAGALSVARKDREPGHAEKSLVGPVAGLKYRISFPILPSYCPE